jgi:hypothetical protein
MFSINETNVEALARDGVSQQSSVCQFIVTCFVEHSYGGN